MRLMVFATGNGAALTYAVGWEHGVPRLCYIFCYGMGGRHRGNEHRVPPTQLCGSCASPSERYLHNAFERLTVLILVVDLGAARFDAVLDLLTVSLTNEAEAL